MKKSIDGNYLNRWEKRLGFIKCSKKNAMKIKYLILLINLLNAQDSLYWFDMSTVRDPVPIALKF